jgi:hypothetical protein
MIDDPLNRTKVKRGSELPQAKLDDSDVRMIRQLIAERNRHMQAAKSLSNALIAEKFGVHYRTIDRISAGESWTHVK